MKHNLHISNRIFSAIFFAALMLCATNAWGIDFTPTQIAAGTTTSGITVSSSFSKSTGKKLCTTKTSEDAISMSSSAGSTYNDKYLWITVPANCKITDVSVLTKSNGDSEVTGAAIFWSGAAAATGVTSTATISAGARNTADCTGAIDLSVPSNTRTVGLYRAPKIKNGAFDNGGSAVGGTSTFNVFSLSVTAICPVNHVLTNATKSSGETTATLGSNYSATYAAPDGYTLPSDIIVKVGSTTQTKGTHYTWTVSAGVGSLSITGTYVADSITVIVTGEAVATCVAPTSVGISGTTSYTEGETISLTAAATGGSGTETYQWYKGGTAEGNKIAGATNATYTKASCTTADAGNYYCAISTGSTCSTFSSVCAVSVSNPNVKTVYLNPNNYANWSKGDERYAIYCFGSGDEWYDFTSFDAGCEGTLYKVTVDKKYTGYVICRMDGGTTENNWGNVWDQTYDITAANGLYCTITGMSGGKASYTYENKPFKVCVSGTWLRFKGETITLTATCAGATHFQWYKGDNVELVGQTSSTLTISDCDLSDAANYYCKAWIISGAENATGSSIYGVKVPYLEYQTRTGDGSTGGDNKRIPLIRANESDEIATCSIYPGVAWGYEYAIYDGFELHGNDGTMDRSNCSGWNMDQSGKRCKWDTDKEGTYHFYVSFSESSFTYYNVSITCPPMSQDGGVPIYMENTPTMTTEGWNNLYYRIGKGKYDNGDSRNYATAQLMTLVPGTARFYQTTTPDWDHDFWAWHIGNNCGSQGDGYAIYQTHSSSEYVITQSINFSGDEIPAGNGWTIYVNDESGIGKDWLNDNCYFHGYTHTSGMLQHNASIGSTENGKIRVTYTHYDNSAQTSEAKTARTLNNLAHTCILTITAVPDCGYQVATLKVNGVDFTSGTTHILDADATITATFTDATHTINYVLDGGTINSGNVTSYVHGTGATLPTDVTKDGKTFGGWYDNSGFTGSPVSSISTTDCGDKTFYATWTTCPALCSGETLYKFEVNSSVGNGNICSSGNNPKTLTTPTQLSALTGGTLEGYITNGSSWNNLTFASGRITYANNDNGVLILTLNCPIREGDLIRFNNYSSSNSKYNYLRHTSNSTSTDQLTLNASKSETEIQQIIAPAAFDGKTELFIVPGSRTTGISYFEIIRPFKVTLDAATNGGTVDGNGTKVLRAANADVIALTHAKKDGYRFKGWYAAPSGGSPVSDAYTVTECITLYAQFEDCPENGTMYKFEAKTGLTNGAVTANNVAFDFNTANYLSTLIGGTLITDGSAASKVEIANTDAFSIKDNSAYLRIDLDCELEEGDIFKSTVSGATIQVTKTSSRASTAVLPVGTLTETPVPASLVGEKTLYLWKGSGNANAISYFEITRPIRTVITLDGAGAFNSYTSSVTATYGQEMPEIERLPQRVGYVFYGYYDAPGGAGTQYYDGLGHGTQNWDKTVSSCTLYAYWKDPCDVAPTLTTIVPLATIWDGQKVDMSLVKLSCDFDTTGISYSLVSASEYIPGCTYDYFDERIYIQGTPTLGNTSVVTKTITFTITNDCSPAHTYTVDATIRIYPADRKGKIAYIITGTKGGAFNAWATADSTQSATLLTYLKGFYDVKCVNGYATKDSAAIAEYYKDYDLLIVTDFMETPEGYTNAIGTMIDKKPILSFEAYVAGSNGTNWHINSNPADPSPKTGTMKVLCAGHAIFGDGEGVEVINKPGGVSDTTITVLSSCSGKGLQGFVINEAPDFIFLATVKDANNNRDLIVSCERQVVFQARLLMYCINFNEMGNLTAAGKVVMHQMIDYLLMTDETKVADCSLVFDNGAGNPSGGGDHLWSNPANWAPGYNIVPTPYHPTRIIAECWVNVDDAHAGSVKVNTGRDEHNNPVDGKLIVRPYGGLTIAGLVATVHDTRYASPITIKAEDLLIEADETGNGAFVYGNKESDVRATVEYYSLGEGANTSSPVWQYIGIPFQASQTAIKMYYAGWMCRWAEGSTDGLGGLWQWVENEDVLLPFEGYCITQNAKKTYTFSGKLNPPITTTLPLDNRDDDGYAFAANSWTAPIKIQEMADEDFVNAEKSIYIYHTGSYAEWTSNGTPVSAVSPGAAATLPGQYAVIPIHSSPYLTGADSVIPSMQGFFIKTTPTEEASLKLVYNRVVYDAKYFKTSTQPLRAPRRTDAPNVMRFIVSGAAFGGDQAYLLERSDFSDGYNDGWDGRKIEGDADAPKLAVVKEAGEMAVATVENADGRYLSFRAGRDTVYTFHFDYEGETLYLYDLLTKQTTEIQTGNTYTFTADNTRAMNRFLITANLEQTPTDIQTTADDANAHSGVRKILFHNQLYILRGGYIYRADGRIVNGKEVMP